MPNLSLINQMLSELVICLKGVFCPGHVREEKGHTKSRISTVFNRNVRKSNSDTRF